jgi:HEAT repeat protein
MTRTKSAVFMLAMTLFCSLAAMAAEKDIFGPELFDVKERYGKDNKYTRTFQASEDLYLIKIQNGEQASGRTDSFEFTVNGEKILREDRYGFGFIACFVKLRKENTFEVNVKDDKPSGFRRPPLPPRSVTITVMPALARIGTSSVGLTVWDQLKSMTNAVQKIKTPGGGALAFAAANLQNDLSVRTEAMRKLSDLKDPSALDFFRFMYNSYLDKPEVCGEAALAVGVLQDVSFIPALMHGVFDPEEKIRVPSARALSFYQEADTAKPLSDALTKLDMIRVTAVIRSIAAADWKPVSTLIGLAQGTDVNVSNTAVEILGTTRDPRAVDQLLLFLAAPGKRDVRTIILALGESRDPRVMEPLLVIANDPVKRKGLEGALGAAFADLGDPRGVVPITEMLKTPLTRSEFDRLAEAYKKLREKDAAAGKP